MHKCSKVVHSLSAIKDMCRINSFELCTRGISMIAHKIGGGYL